MAASGTAHTRWRGDGARTVPAAGGGTGVNVSSCVSINDLTVRMAWLAGLALVALLLAGWRKTARAQPKRPRRPTDSPPRRVPHTVQAGVAPPYHAAGPAAPGVGRRGQLRAGARDRRRAGDRHGVQPGVGRHDADRPAQVLGDGRPARRRASPGTPATWRRRRRDSTADDPASGPPRSARSTGSGCSTTTASRPRSTTPTPACAGAPSSWPRSVPASTCVGPLADPDDDRRRGRRMGLRRARGRAPTTCWPRSSSWPPARRGQRPARARGRRRRARGDRRRPRARRHPRRTTDRPAIRRRAVLALAPFVDPATTGPAEVAAGARTGRRPTATGRSARPPRTSAPSGEELTGTASSGRRSCRGARSRCAGTAGWRPPVTAGSSG